MNSKEIIEKYDSSVMHTYGRLPLAEQSGSCASCSGVPLKATEVLVFFIFLHSLE